MDSSRAAAVASSVLAQEALSLVSAHHPRGLASFAVDAHVASSELSLALSASFRGVRLAYALARPYKGCVPDRRLLGDYRSLYAAHLVLWALANDAADHLSTFTAWTLLPLLRLSVLSFFIGNRHNEMGESQHEDASWSLVDVDGEE